MRPYIRSEDFDIVGDRMILGGRVIAGSSILSSQVEK